MAEVAATITPLRGGKIRISWASVTESDTFGIANIEDLGGLFGCNLQITGTFGGASITIKGSIDGGSTFGTVKQGNTLGAAGYTAASFTPLQDMPTQIQPTHSGGTSESVNVYIEGLAVRQ